MPAFRFGRRAPSPLLEVVIRRMAAIHRPPRKLRLAGISLTDSAAVATDSGHSADHK
jgi:hypothetical protein